MENRRTFLKQLLALGVAAPLTTAHSTALAGVVRRGGPQARTISARASSRQLAGQRVIYSYAGLSVPDTLLQAIRTDEAAGRCCTSRAFAQTSQCTTFPNVRYTSLLGALGSSANRFAGNGGPILNWSLRLWVPRSNRMSQRFKKTTIPCCGSG